MMKKCVRVVAIMLTWPFTVPASAMIWAFDEDATSFWEVLKDMYRM